MDKTQKSVQLLYSPCRLSRHCSEMEFEINAYEGDWLAVS